MRTLRLRLADLVREAGVLRAGVANAEVLKREVHGLGRQVLQERAKVQALGQELENPLNVHRRAPLDLPKPWYSNPTFRVPCQTAQPLPTEPNGTTSTSRSGRSAQEPPQGAQARPRPPKIQTYATAS
jgi:hypothetical protein